MSKKAASTLSSSAAVLDSTALQDHLIRALRVDFSEPRRLPVQSSSSTGLAPKPHGKPAVAMPVTSASSASRGFATSMSTASDGKVGVRPPERKPALSAARAQPGLKAHAAAKPITALHSTGALASRLASRWTCDACDNLNPATARECGSCGAGKAADIVAVAPALSLAQKRGLVPAPAALLTPAQWAAIEARAQARLIAGGQGSCLHDRAAAEDNATERDRENPAADDPVEDEGAAALPEHANAAGGDAAARASFACPICFESFGLREQVLLSCSHTFHRCCLDSFEAYQRREIMARGTVTADGSAGSGSGVASLLQCPVCRGAGYQKRRTRVAARLHVLRCIVAIQAVWRGRVTRRAFWELRKAFWMGVTGSVTEAAAAAAAGSGSGSGARATSSLAEDTGRRRAFAGEMLARLQTRLAGAQARRSDAVSAVLASADREVAASRDVLAAADARIAERLRQREQMRAALLAAPEPSSRLGSASVASGGTLAAASAAFFSSAAAGTASAGHSLAAGGRAPSASAALAHDILERAVERELEVDRGLSLGVPGRAVPGPAAPASAATRWWQPRAHTSAPAASAGAGVGGAGTALPSAASALSTLPASGAGASPLAGASLDWPSVRESALSRMLNYMREALTRKAQSAKQSVQLVVVTVGHHRHDGEEDDDGDEDAACEACPICIMPLLDSHVAEALLACGGKGAGGATAALAALSAPARASCSNISVLSCTHALHTRCAASLERFVSTGTSYEPSVGPGAAGSRSSAAPAITIPGPGAKCPTCRAPYSRTSLC